MRMSERYIVSFLKRHHIIIASLSLALFSLHLALTDKKESTRGFILKEVLYLAASPLQNMILTVESSVTGVWGDYISLVGVKEENDSLRKTILGLQEENSRLKEDVNLNSRLKELLAFKEHAEFKTLPAGIIGVNNDGWTKTITINKGRSDGVTKDLAVISPLGVVGKIIDANNHTSVALINTDVRSDMDVLVQRSRVKGVVEGNGGESLILKYVRQIDDVQIGDQVVTSGLSGIFPKGLIVGEVTKIEKGKDNFFKYIEVRPKVDIQKLEDVLVVTDTGRSSN